MDVVDFLKKKKEMIATTQADMKDYWSEVSQNMTVRIQQTRDEVSEQWQSLLKEALQKTGNLNHPMLAYKENSPAEQLRTELAKEIGQESFIGDWLELNQERINQFAQVTGDLQWIHTDPERAEAESPFKTTIAHGFLTLSLIPYLTKAVDENAPAYPTAKMCVNYGMDNVRFQFPVKVGNKIRACSKLTRVVSIKNGLEITREVKIEIEGVRRPAVVLDSIVRVYF